MERKLTVDGEWFFMAWKGKDHWIGLAKREPFAIGHPLCEPGEVWFSFGSTEAEAIAKVKRDVLGDPLSTQ